MNGTMYTLSRPQPPAATPADPLSPPTYGHGQHHYQGVYGHGGGGSGALSSHHHSAGSPGGLLGTSNTASTQLPTLSSATASHMDPYSRPAPTPTYYSTASTSHQPSFSYLPSPTAPSPTTSAGSPSGLLGTSNTASTQLPTPSSATASHMDPYSRPTPTPTYYSTASAPTPHQPSFSYQPSSTALSPTTSAGGSRGLHALSGHATGMAPPQAYRPPYHTFHMQVPSMPGGTVMTNLNNPNGRMSMVSGMGMQAYGHPMHHLYNHGTAPQPERPFKCDQCPQSFNRNHDLKRHKRIHLSVKPFPCGSCDKAFSRKDALKRHRLVKGCGDPSRDEGMDDTPGRSDISDSESPTITKTEI